MKIKIEPHKNSLLNIDRLIDSSTSHIARVPGNYKPPVCCNKHIICKGILIGSFEQNRLCLNELWLVICVFSSVI